MVGVWGENDDCEGIMWEKVGLCNEKWSTLQFITLKK